MVYMKSHYNGPLWVRCHVFHIGIAHQYKIKKLLKDETTLNEIKNSRNMLHRYYRPEFPCVRM